MTISDTSRSAPFAIPENSVNGVIQQVKNVGKHTADFLIVSRPALFHHLLQLPEELFKLRLCLFCFAMNEASCEVNGFRNLAFGSRAMVIADLEV
jgi:hypothetical protein